MLDENKLEAPIRGHCSHVSPDGASTRAVLLRSFGLAPAITGLTLTGALLVLVLTSWRTLYLVRPVREHLLQLQQIDAAALAAETLLVRLLTSSGTPPAADVNALARTIRSIGHDGTQPDADVKAHLDRASASLERYAAAPRPAFELAIVELRAAMRAETAVQSRLVEAMRAYSDRELITAGATFLGLPVVAALVVFLLRDRIFSSLDGVNRLLERLSRRDYSPASVEHVGPELKRVIESYNALVTRLAAAEAETAERRQKLESQVRSATSTVLRQQQEMAAANRLAAIGETSARIAHELRNPLAGIELALANISRDLEQTPGSETTQLLARLDPVIGELQRMSRLLTEQLEGTRRAPERPVAFELSIFLAETVALIRYQTPENIALDVEVPEPVRCRLPRDMLRQTVFNLALNAVRAIDDGCGRVVFRAVRRDGTLDLDIEDNGPGFPEDLLATGPRLFVSGRPTGTGIGLATARRMTQGMGGDLALANRREGGAVVRLTLPCGAPDA